MEPPLHLNILGGSICRPVTATINPANLIAEKDETNNVRTDAITAQ